MSLKTTSLNSENGLPNEQVHAIKQDASNRLWMAGPAGLICYNGSNVKVFDIRHGLDSHGLRTISITPDNLIWIGTDRGLEAMYTDGRKKPLTFNFSWTYGIVESIWHDGTYLWLGTSYGLLKLHENDGVLDFISKSDLGLVTDIISTDNDQMLIGSGKYGLIIHDGTNWKPFNQKLSKKDSIFAIKKTVDNYFLVGTEDGLYLLDPGGEIIDLVFLPGKEKRATSIAVIGDEWWVAFGQTLALASPGAYEVKVKETILVKSRINDLFVDSINNVWVATNSNGIKKITCLREILTTVDCYHDATVFSIKKGIRTNEILVSGDGFCSKVNISGNLTKPKPKLFAEFPSIVWNTCIDPVDQTTLWFATQDGLYRSIAGKQPTRFTGTGDVIYSPNRVLISRNDEVWLGTVSGLFRIYKNTVKEALNAKGEPLGYVYSLCLTENNDLLIGTLGNGLWVESPGGIVQVINKFLTPKGNTYAINTNGYGDTAVIQEERVVIIDADQKAKLVFSEFPLAGWSVSWTDSNTIAIGSNEGLIIINVLNAKVENRISAHLSKSEWQFSSTNSLHVAADGRFYCGLNAGLIVVDVKKLSRFSIAPKVFVNEITWRNVTPHEKEGVFFLSTGKWSVNVSLYSAWFVDEKQVQFRFKLAGFDEDWSELSALPSINYNSLPPGAYELLVSAFTPLTGIGGPVSVLKVKVSIPFWSWLLNPIVSGSSSAYNFLFGSIFRNRSLLEKNKVLVKEIEERAYAEQELKKYKDQLEDMVANRTKAMEAEKKKAQLADQMKTAFLAKMAHEIRTPVSGIIGLNNLMADTNLDNQQANYLSKINNTVNYLSHILNDILDLSKIEAGKMELEHIAFPLNELLSEVKDYGLIKSKAKGISFEIIQNVKTDAFIFGDPLRVKQVLFNLISNAIKFTDEGIVKLIISQAEETADSVFLNFEVTDTGIGMTTDQVNSLFSEFQQADSSTARKYGGTGLGLNICYQFLEMMDSYLDVKSEPGKGSSFYFKIQFDKSPTLSSNDAPAKLKTKQTPRPESDEKTKKSQKLLIKYPPGFDEIRKNTILIAEDNQVNQFIIKKMLEKEGFTVKLASNGKECIEILEKNPDIPLILMDIQMPEMDGLEAANHIRKTMNNQQIKIMALSAHVFAGMKEKTIDSGMDDFLPKPIDWTILFAKMVKWLKPNQAKK